MTGQLEDACAAAVGSDGEGWGEGGGAVPPNLFASVVISAGGYRFTAGSGSKPSQQAIAGSRFEIGAIRRSMQGAWQDQPVYLQPAGTSMRF